MRLPLQNQTRAQRRQLLGQLVWSLCLVAPGSLTNADEGADKKTEPSLAPAVTLPAFPSALTPAPTSPAKSPAVSSNESRPNPGTPAPVNPDKSKASVPTPTAGTNKPTEQVSIKFGGAADPAKATRIVLPNGQAALPKVESTEAPATFRLSDKSVATPASPVASSKALPIAPTTPAPKVAPTVTPTPVSAPTATLLKAPVKPVESKSVMPEAVQSPATAIGSLTISKDGVGPSTVAKSDVRREAVLIRPKAIILGQEPVAIAQADSVTPESKTTSKTDVLPGVKPSTSPQNLAGKSEGSNSAKMKSVDSKVSPLPPTQLLATEEVVEPSRESSKPQVDLKAPVIAIAAAPTLTTEQVADPQKPTTVAPLAVATVATPKPSLIFTEDTEPPVVSDAEILTETKLATAKKYSKPADRTIQVGTVALTTMRVGEKDIVKCEVDDTSVCRAIVTSDGEVALLPGKVGITRATLWVKQPDGQSKVETADIQVGEVLPIDNSDSVEIGKLNDNLQRLYPNTTLRVVASDRCIEICGEADTEQQAREVLQLVRKLCLVPVKDKVTVR